MKKKTNWKTFAGLALAAGTWLKLAGDFPIGPLITPPTQVCAYPNLSYGQLQLRLFNLDVSYEEGKLTREFYDKERAKLIYCRGLRSFT